jgi:hypothetical protein
MSEQAKKSNIVQLVAVERGFMPRGSLGPVTVEPGTTFTFDRTPHPDTPAHKLAEDGLRRLPKWARLKDEAQKVLAEKAAKVKAADTRPVAVKNAVQRKGAELAGAGDSLA